MAKTSPSDFIRQVRQEVSKVTWSSRKETVASTVVVLVLVFISALFFLLVDGIIFNVVQAILGF